MLWGAIICRLPAGGCRKLGARRTAPHQEALRTLKMQVPTWPAGRPVPCCSHTLMLEQAALTMNAGVLTSPARVHPDTPVLHSSHFLVVVAVQGFQVVMFVDARAAVLGKALDGLCDCHVQQAHQGADNHEACSSKDGAEGR